MSIDTTKAMNYSWMSQAAYLDLVGIAANDTGALIAALQSSPLNNQNKFVEQQAKAFTNVTNGYSFINQLPNTVNGTSATLFKSNADGSYTIAVRGTEPDAQFITDLLQDAIGVVLAGKAKVQLIEAYRYYKQLTTAVGQAVTYGETEVSMLSAVLMSGTPLTGGLENLAAAKSTFAVLTANDKGLGLVPSGATINFAGHSLGGHVAYLLADLVSLTSGGTHPLGDVMTYNAPGENTLLYEWGNWLGLDTSDHSGLIGSKHLAFYGEAGLNVTAGLGQVIGTRVPLFIEGEGTVSLENHSIVKLSDSLALYDAYSKLAPGLQPAQIETLLKASSATMNKTLESALDALRTLLIDGTIATDATKQTPTGNRDAFYTNLYVLQDNANYTSLTNTTPIIVLAGQAAGSLAAQAKNDFGTFLALDYLLPFAIQGSGSVLIGVHGDLYQGWAADRTLTAAQKDDGAANYGDRWYADRANLLERYLSVNSADRAADPNGYHRFDNAGETMRYIDLASGFKVQDVRADGSAILEGTGYVVFGTDVGDTTGLEGSTQTDRLYGMGGDDTLRGMGGADRLEGGTGQDEIDGGDGNDILVGGAGDDKLTGAKDNDTLQGGTGQDTYVFASGDGWDWIIDSDGQGEIEYDGVVLTGGDQVADNVWRSADNRYTYSLYDRTDNGRTIQVLAIQGPDGGMWVKDWQEGRLGISLHLPPAPVPPAATLTGTDGPDNGMLLATAHEPSLFATAANQQVLGLGGADYLWARHAGDLALGGLGNDILVDGAGAQELDGEDGNDILIATSGDDTLLGGQGEDALQGGEGNDRLDGGAGMDFIDGGTGADVIDGGDGDDFILGGGNLTPVIHDCAIPGPADGLDYETFASGEGSFFLSFDSAGRSILPALAGVTATTPEIGLPTDRDNRGIGYAMVEGDGADRGPDRKSRRWWDGAARVVKLGADGTVTNERVWRMAA
jgi:Ca2+-binding RTX toxin-like protein